MSYRVVIPTAGTGSRLNGLTKYINKSLVGIANRPAISHLIEQFPDDCEFVIALGHKGNLLRDFLELAYPERTFFFALVDPYDGDGSGLGLSLLACEQYLQQPFIFLSCDTLVQGKIPKPDHNWMGYAQVNDLFQYRTLQLQDDKLTEICEKGVIKNNIHPYIGLAGIYNYQDFWRTMHDGKYTAIEQGESYGIRHIIKGSNVSAYQFKWFDTGNPKALEITRKAYAKPNEPNILEKENEAIWFIGDTVVKYSDDKIFIANRVNRASELKGFVPDIYAHRANMYCYKIVEAEVLSNIVTLPIFDNLMNHCKSFWVAKILDAKQNERFKQNCLIFYKDKTLERVQLFYNNFEQSDDAVFVNGEKMPALNELLDAIDWNWLSDGLAGRFHGDFHFENILWSQEGQKFTFLDWRQDFAGDLTVGDIYYDFAKLMHGLIVNHGIIANDQYSALWKDGEIKYDLHRKQSLVECEHKFNNWIVSSGYDLKKVRILTALIYLNIAALHHYPYSLLLYGLGKKMLYKESSKEL